MEYIFLDVFLVLIGFNDGFFVDFIIVLFFGVSVVLRGEELGDVDVEGVVVGIGEFEVFGGEDDIVL